MAEPVPMLAKPGGLSVASIVISGNDLGAIEKGLKERSATPVQEKIEPAHLQGFQLWSVIAGLCLVMVLSGLDFTLLATAIPTITSEFDSLEDIGWYASTYIIAACAFMPLLGKIFRQFDIRYVYLLSLLVFEIGSVVCATAPSSAALIVGRAIAGIGAAGLYPGNVIVVSHIAPRPKQPFYTSIVMAFFSIATVLGPVIGGALTQRVTWRWCFWINLPLGAVAFAIIAIVFRPQSHGLSEPTLRKKLLKLDPIGFVLFASLIAMLLLAVQWGGHAYPWNSSVVIGLFCGFAATSLVFILWQRHEQDNASIPPRIFKQRNIFLGALAAILSMGATQVIVFYLPIWFQVVQSATPIESGVRYLATVIPNVIVSLLGGLLIGKIGYFNPPFLFGCALVCIGTGLLTTLQVTTAAGSWIGFQIIFGAGFGLIVQAPSIIAQVTLPLPDIPAGASIMSVARFIGASLWVAIAQNIFESRLVAEMASHDPSIDATRLIDAGATGLRDVATSQDIPAVLEAYNKAITQTFYSAAATAVLSIIVVAGMTWTRKKV